jgi:hypothetical protein
MMASPHKRPAALSCTADPVRLRLITIALAASCWASAPLAQGDLTLTPEAMRALSLDLVNQDRLAEAADLTDALLARDPADTTALILRARIALATGDFAGAVSLASRAFRSADQDDQRYAAARIAARGHAELLQDTRAQWWLRRAGNVAPDNAAEQSVAEDFRFLRQRNPLAVSLQFGISPSSNVNGGSLSEVIILPGLPFEFVLDGAARALSGLQFEGGVNLSYRLNMTETSANFVDVALQGRTYILSAEARDLAPDARGSDFADLTATVSFTHRWLPQDARGPWSLTGTLGQTWYDDERYLGFGQLLMSKTTRLDAGRRLDLTGFVDVQNRLQDDEQFAALGGRLRWSWTTPRNDTASVSAGFRDTLSELPDVAFDGLSIGATYQFEEPIFSVRLGLGADVEYRRFAESFYSFDPREDWRGSLRLTVGLPEFTYYGFEPQVIFRANQTESNVALFDSRSLSLDFGIRSTF